VTKSVCIVGGGMSGVGLWWCLSQPGQPGSEWNVTVLHDGSSVGGHALTVTVNYKDQQIPVDTGVQFFVPLIYRNIDAILKRPEFASVRTAAFRDLQVGCAFPEANGKPQNWGNFPTYGATDSAKTPGSQFALFSPAMWNDATTFQTAVDMSVVHRTLGHTIDAYFEANRGEYQDPTTFQNMFLAPYLSIINGYGATLSDQVTFGDLLPLFGSLGSGSRWPGLARFTQPCQGYARFVDGATSFIQAMADAASANGRDHTLALNCDVQAVYPDPSNAQQATVEWTDGNGNKFTQSFDKVVITTDMQSAANLLAAGPGDAWSEVYKPYICPIATQLLPGYCLVHSDESVLSPDLLNGDETLQFTAYYAANSSCPSGYNLFLTYTTYLQGNIHSEREREATGLYLTMYGYLPSGVPPPVIASNPCDVAPVTPYPTKIPAGDKILFQEYWMHGMWLPQFMLKEKRQLHMAQGPGKYTYPGQSPYPIYFAGNNTTADSLEHAFISGAIIADYAFDAPLPVSSDPLAYAMYALFYYEFMFPGASLPERHARLLDRAVRST
jgi:NAD(P)-binding Rossmann-like domain